MKRILFSLLALVGATSLAHAQQAVPQGGLETWATRGAALAPTGWVTTNDIVAASLPFPFPINTNTVSRVTPGHSGTYAAELKTGSVSGFSDVPGLLLLGNAFKESFYDLPSGVPYTSRPAALEFYYKLTGSGVATDSAAVLVQLTRTVGGTPEVVAEATHYFDTPAAVYRLFSLPLIYSTANTPDTLRIGFVSSAKENVVAGTINFTIDDVRMSNTVAATRDAAADAALSLYPTTSADGQFTVAAPSRPELLRGALSVSDAAGRVVLRQPAASVPASRTLDLRGQAAGVYIMRLETTTGPLTRKLIML